MLVWAPALAVFVSAVTPAPAPFAIVTSNDTALDDALAKAAPRLSSPVVARDTVKHAEREAQKLGLKCSADDAACNAKIGVLAGAASVIVPRPVGATFTLALIDVAAGKELATAGPFAKKGDALTALEALLAPAPALSAALPSPPDPLPPRTTTTAAPDPTSTPAITTPATATPAVATTTGASSLFVPLSIGAGVVGLVAIGCGVGAAFEDIALYDPQSRPPERASVRALGQSLTYVGVGAGVVAIAVGATAFAFSGP